MNDLADFPRDDELTVELVMRAASGDADALETLFQQHRDRLKRMVGLRLNHRLRGRVDDSDIVQDALVDASRKLEDYARGPILPFYFWLRQLTQLKLVEVHRHHLGTKMRDARLEVTFQPVKDLDVSSVVMAEYFAATDTSASEEIMRRERQQLLQAKLEEMDEADREIIALKHFEQFTIAEVAHLLKIPRATAGHRYLSSLKRLRGLLEGLVDFEN